jgi:hypothetical protein
MGLEPDRLEKVSRKEKINSEAIDPKPAPDGGSGGIGFDRLGRDGKLMGLRA